MKDKPVILVVDDEPQNIELLEAHLVPQGYEIVKAANGAEALGKLSDNQIDLILLDVKMPGMDGFEVTRRVRQDNAHRLLPIILVTVLRETEDRVKGIEAGCDDFISYPVDKMELLSRVVFLLKVKAYNDLMSHYQKELESEVTRRTEELKHALENLQQDIVERKLAEAALLKSEERYRVIFEGSTQGIIMTDNETRRVLYANPSICRMLGYSDVELMQLSIADIHPKESLDQLTSDLKSQTQGKKPISSAIPCLRKDGTVFYADISGANTKINGRECNVGFFLDITERKRAEEKLHESEEKYRHILGTIDDGYFEADLAGNFTFFNPSLCRILGYPREDMPGMNNRLFMDAENAKEVFRAFNEVYVTGIPTKGFELETIRKDGTRVYIEVSLSLIVRPGEKPTGFRGIARDVTERKRAEEKLQQTLESLRKAFGATIQAMVSAVESRDPYTAGHQIRSADLACAIATEMGLPPEIIDGIRRAGSIHDIGKLSIPAEILSKHTKLTNIEFSLIKEHPQKGYEMLKDVESPWPLAQIVYQHHERMDGSGCRRNLKGDEILMEARILAIADVVEAIASHRPYRPDKGIT